MFHCADLLARHPESLRNLFDCTTPCSGGISGLMFSALVHWIQTSGQQETLGLEGKMNDRQDCPGYIHSDLIFNNLVLLFLTMYMCLCVLVSKEANAQQAC